MLNKMTIEDMAARLKAYTPSVNNLLVEPTAIGNAILTFGDFVDNKPLQLGLNMFGQYFAPFKSWTELGSLEIQAEIGFQIQPATLTMSSGGVLQKVTGAGTVVDLTGSNLVSFAEHVLALYRFWYTSPAFRSAGRSCF